MLKTLNKLLREAYAVVTRYMLTVRVVLNDPKDRDYFLKNLYRANGSFRSEIAQLKIQKINYTDSYIAFQAELSVDMSISSGRFDPEKEVEKILKSFDRSYNLIDAIDITNIIKYHSVDK